MLRLRGKQNFLQQFITPIVKATKDGQVKQFYTMVEYEKWKKKSKDGAGWKIKYYKGLGTSTAAEAKEYFSKIHDHRIEFRRHFLADTVNSKEMTQRKLCSII